uniref:Uncharacterized protein n=1 Tax=Heliothis virescens TaxID=7102 RepID=A0A2A4JFB1_HELVI
MSARRQYSNQEYLEMLLCYRECNQVLVRAVHLYQQRFGVRVSHHTILNAVYRFREHGRFDPPPVNAGRPSHSAKLEEEVLGFFRHHPLASTRDAARVFDVSDNYVWRLLNREGLHPYHFTRVQELQPADYAARLAFCSWLRKEPRNIMWTDESTFTRIGMFNIHNAHYWTETNPRVARPDHILTRFSVNVWAGILGNRLLGPVFLDRLNGDTYLELLETRVRRMLERIPLAEVRGLYFQHDGAAAHFASNVREYLNGVWYGGERWIGRGGPVPWPPRSPDLTPLDFLFWGRIKDLVYGQTGHDIRSVDELKRRIKRSFRQVKSDRDTLNRVKRHVRKRANICVQREGGYVQQFCK